MRTSIGSLLIILFLGVAHAQDKPAATLTPHKVKGLTVPASIAVTDTDLKKKIVPVFDNPSLVLDVKFKAISSGDTDPSMTVKGSGKDSYVEIDVPKKGDAILVFCYALYGGDKPWITDPAQTIVEWGSGLPPPTTNPPETQPPVTNPPVTNPPVSNVDQVFASVKKIHCILILDMQTANQELAVITQNQALIKQHFEQPNTGNKYWQFDVRDAGLKASNITTPRKDAQGRTIDGPVVDAQGKVKVALPCLVLLDTNSSPAKIIGQPMPVKLTGNPTSTITDMLTAIAQALKR